MDKAYIESIIAIAEEHDLDALEVEDDTGAVRVVRRSSPMPAAAAAPPQNRPSGPSPSSTSPLPEGVLAATSPVVGIFCPAPPDGGSPVQPGDSVAEGQVLGYVEAMKMATEVTAPAAGSVAEILAAEGQAVQFGDPLFQIRTADGED